MLESRCEASWLPHVGASAACSRRVYLIFSSARDFIMKNIDLCFRFSSSLNKVTLTKTSDTTR